MRSFPSKEEFFLDGPEPRLPPLCLIGPEILGCLELRDDGGSLPAQLLGLDLAWQRRDRKILRALDLVAQKNVPRSHLERVAKIRTERSSAREDDVLHRPLSQVGVFCLMSASRRWERDQRWRPFGRRMEGKETNGWP